MKRTRVHLIAGARPNFMKVGPLYRVLLQDPGFEPRFVHTGQHYDHEMSGGFLESLGLPQPHHALNIGSGSHAEQTAAVLVGYERVCRDDRPDWVIVVGDVNSTLAAALTAKKLDLPVAHVEAGLRSGDRSMPEEINRLATDAISDLLWTPSPDASENLEREGIPPERIEFVGNIMIDSLEMLRDRIRAQEHWRRYGLVRGGYGVVTLHRPSNVDHLEVLLTYLKHLERISAILPLVFPVHPRTRQRIDRLLETGAWRCPATLHCAPPLDYVAFTSLLEGSRVAITDSGGVQEETTFLGIPCLTVRQTTERPVTLTEGTNRLVPEGDLERVVVETIAGAGAAPRRPALWDGNTSMRILRSLKARIA